MRWGKSTPKFSGLSAFTITFIPNLDGYWIQSLTTLQICLESFFKTVSEPRHLCVFDNGSCTEVVVYLRGLRDRGLVDTLIESGRNIGKVAAWNALFSLPSAETIAFFDSDVWFLEGWLEDSMKVLDAFPEAATVTAQPIAGSLERHCDATLGGAKKDPTVRIREGKDLIPREYVESHRLGLGETKEIYRKRIVNRRDVLLTRGGVDAFVSSSHFQFVGRANVLKSYFPLPTASALGDDHVFDERVDESGRWRLSTHNYRIHHLGNRTPDLAQELPWVKPIPQTRTAGLDSERACPGTNTGSFKRRILGSRFFRAALKKLNSASFRWLYPDS